MLSNQCKHLLLLADVMSLTATEESAVGANALIAAGQTDQFFDSLMFLADS